MVWVWDCIIAWERAGIQNNNGKNCHLNFGKLYMDYDYAYPYLYIHVLKIGTYNNISLLVYKRNKECHYSHWMHMYFF